MVVVEMAARTAGEAVVRAARGRGGCAAVLEGEGASYSRSRSRWEASGELAPGVIAIASGVPHSAHRREKRRLRPARGGG